jgi:malate synthase
MSAAVIRGRSTTNEGRRVDEVLTPGAIDFLVQLHRQFESTRCSLLQRRARRQQKLLSGSIDPKDFVPDIAANVRYSDWKIAPVPRDLQDRRVEITGPASSKKMVLNALSSGASCFMADLEDASMYFYHFHFV